MCGGATIWRGGHMLVEAIFWFHPLVWWLARGWWMSASVLR